MSLHDKAWQGLNILIFGSTPTLPSRIQEAICLAAPLHQNRIHSFENYENALDHCKKTKNTGLIILLDDSSSENLTAYFREFAKSYESRGFPCFGILISKEQKTIQGFQAKDSNRHFLAYLNLQELVDPGQTIQTLNKLWHNYVEAFEIDLLPIQLQESLFSIIDEEIDLQSIHFIDRVSLILSAQLNISWLEAFSIRWTPLIYSIPRKFYKVILPHQDLISLCPTLIFASLITEPIESIVKTKTPLWCQISAISYHLNEKRLQKNLNETLNAIKNSNRTESTEILRLLVHLSPTILEAALQEEKATLS